MKDKTPYAFAIYRTDAANPKATTRWHADTEYGIVRTLLALADMVCALPAGSVKGVTIIRVDPK